MMQGVWQFIGILFPTYLKEVWWNSINCSFQNQVFGMNNHIIIIVVNLWYNVIINFIIVIRCYIDLLKMTRTVSNVLTKMSRLLWTICKLFM